MRKVFFFAVFMCFLFLPAQAEGGQAESFSEMEAILTDADVPVGLKEMFSAILTQNISFSPEKITDALTDAARSRVQAVSKFLTKAAFFMLLTAFFKRLLPEGRSGKGAVTAIHLIVALSMHSQVRVFFSSAKTAISRILSLVDTLTPMLVSVIAFTGDAHTSAFITPLGAFVSGSLSAYFQKGALRIVEALYIMHLASSVSDMPVGRMMDAVKSLFKWLIGAVMGVFLFFMSTGGSIAGAYDGALVKGLKFAADSLIPIVGSDIAGKMESITGSAQLVKSAAGVTGMVALVSACLFPAMDIFLAMWGLKILSALMECASDRETASLIDGFSGIFSLLFSLILASLCMAIMYVGVSVGIGRRALF